MSREDNSESDDGTEGAEVGGSKAAAMAAGAGCLCQLESQGVLGSSAQDSPATTAK